MGERFCKTCRFLVADRAKQMAACHYWVDFAKNGLKPWGCIAGPTFQPMVISPRHIWDDLPTPPELSALGHDHSSEKWSETMDCQTWESAARVQP